MNVNCLRCGHPFNAHAKDQQRECRRKKLTGWNEEARQFTGEEVCDCPGYLGRIPTESKGKHGCPHELIDGSRVCVVCKEPVPVKVKR